MNKSPNFKRNKTISELISDTRKPKREADTAWYKIGASQAYGIAFQNSWANVGGTGIPDASFCTDENGWVKLKGKIDGGAAGTTIFTLPEECRPEHYEPFVLKVDGGGTANVGVFPNGEVVLEDLN